MSFVRNDIRVGHACEVTRSPMRMELRQPTPRITPCKRVQRCYTLMQAAEAVGIQIWLTASSYPLTRRSKTESSDRMTISLIKLVAPGQDFACWKSVLGMVACCEWRGTAGPRGWRQRFPRASQILPQPRSAGLLLHLPRPVGIDRMAGAIRRRDRQRLTGALGATRRCASRSNE